MSSVVTVTGARHFEVAPALGSLADILESEAAAP